MLMHLNFQCSMFNVQWKISTFAPAFRQSRLWRDGRVVDYSSLENCRTERCRGFESLSLRNKCWLSVIYENYAHNYAHFLLIMCFFHAFFETACCGFQNPRAWRRHEGLRNTDMLKNIIRRCKGTHFFPNRQIFEQEKPAGLHRRAGKTSINLKT